MLPAAYTDSVMAETTGFTRSAFGWQPTSHTMASSIQSPIDPASPVLSHSYAARIPGLPGSAAGWQGIGNRLTFM
ncbi:hypothetical protein GCM10027511_14010 [Hymenobacter humi]